VRRHLEGLAVALVVDRPLLDIRIRNRVNLFGVEDEVGRGGMEVEGCGVEALEHLCLFIGGCGGCGGGGKGGAAGQQEQRDGRGEDDFRSETHESPQPI